MPIRQEMERIIKLGWMPWAVVFLAAIARPALGLNEFFEIYNAPQALAMGNAFTAEASGANSLFYNPAGLARAEGRKWAFNLFSVDAAMAAGSLANFRNLWADAVLPSMAAGTYQYTRFNVVPSISHRNFAIALLGTYEFAGLSDGTNIDLNYHKDFGVVVGTSTNLFSNLVKIGVAGKVFDRSEMLGTYTVASMASNPTLNRMAEGLGIGVDAGVLLTLPMSFLPSLGFAWKDILGTAFRPLRIFNTTTVGAPTAIAQSFNVGFSIRPILWRGTRAVITADLRHLERTDLPLTKKLHFGLQIMAHRSFFIWAGMNQMLPTGGFGLRLPGGDFEIGTYAADIGDATTVTADRRLQMRWTIGF